MLSDKGQPCALFFYGQNEGKKKGKTQDMTTEEGTG